MDDHTPTSDRLRRLASRYEAGVGRGRAEQIAARAITRAHRRASVGRRLAVAVSSSAFLLVSLTGVGLAADRAVPGDVLYPLDRALEALGFDSDLVEERLLEAITLTERGDMDLAIATANEALAELGRSGVTATLPAVTPDTATLTAETVEPQSTTTTENPDITPIDSTEVDDPIDDAADAPTESTEPAVEPVDALRLAAEQLLQSVRSAKTDGGTTEDVTAAAIFLAEATANVTSIDLSVATTTTSSTSSTTTPSSTTTTTTQPDPRPGTRNGNTDESGTTTTTVASDPDDGSGSDDSSGGGEDGSTGPIFLPSP